MSRRTRAKDLRRGPAKRAVKKTVMIFCEGVASEPDYLKGLKRLPAIKENNAIDIQIDPVQGVPSTLVDEAIRRKKADPEIDELWCVFDVEWPKHHPALKESIERAEAKGIKVAVSNPNFELWLILHFSDHTSFLINKDAESLSKSFDGRGDKNIDPSLYLENRKIASDRARKLAAKHLKDGSFCPDDNPSSGMYLLLESIDPSSFKDDKEDKANAKVGSLSEGSNSQ